MGPKQQRELFKVEAARVVRSAIDRNRSEPTPS
jgi:hypothetical protein